MRKILQCFAVLAPVLAAVPAHAAYTTFFGEDMNFSATAPLLAIPNVTAAQNAFMSNLVNVGVETFETVAPYTTSPHLTLGSVTASINGGSSGYNMVSTVTPGQTNGAGRYSVPAGISSNYYEVAPMFPDWGFSISFDRPVAAFGFVGIDIGEFGGHLKLSFYDAADNMSASLTVPNSTDQTADGSILYFGVIASNTSEQFKSVKFELDAGSVDSFGFDNFSVAELRQVAPPAIPSAANVPEPSSLALVGLALAAAVRTRRRNA